MGNIVSTAGRYIVRKTRRFNVENRAMQYLDQEKLPIAPKHPNTAKLLENITNDPILKEQLVKKNTQLDENLKQVYVKSLHKTPMTFEEEIEKKKKSKLPQERGSVNEDLKFGHVVPIVIPKGKFSLNQVFDFLTAHYADPNTVTPAAIAKQYQVDEHVIKSVINYFKFFRVEVRSKEAEQKLLAREIMKKFNTDTMNVAKDLKDFQLDKNLKEQLKKEEKIRQEEHEEFSETINRKESIKPKKSFKDKIFGETKIK